MAKRNERVTGHVDTELKNRVNFFCGANSCSESELINSALKNFLEDEDNWSIVFKRLNRQQKALSNLDRRLEIFTEAFLLFLKYWFALTPNLTELEQKQATGAGDSRFGKFMLSLKNIISRGGLLHENLETHLENLKENQKSGHA